MSCWLQITSGRGPEECGWVVGQLLGILQREAASAGLKLELLEAVPGASPRVFLSALLSVEGSTARSWAAGWAGTIQWIGQSPFRPHHKRKNWFVGVSVIHPPEHPTWREQEIRVESFRASGPGGQHVNKTASAVRIIHVPTGIVATAQEERSQHRNRDLALARLAERLENLTTQREAASRQERWEQHNQLERGAAAHVFKGPAFTKVEP